MRIQFLECLRGVSSPGECVLKCLRMCLCCEWSVQSGNEIEITLANVLKRWTHDFIVLECKILSICHIEWRGFARLRACAHVRMKRLCFTHYAVHTTHTLGRRRCRCRLSGRQRLGPGVRFGLNQHIYYSTLLQFVIFRFLPFSLAPTTPHWILGPNHGQCEHISIRAK